MKKISFVLEDFNDPNMDCIVCRRMGVDACFSYRTRDGRASQGIHKACVERAESLWNSHPPTKTNQPVPDMKRCTEVWKRPSDERWVQCELPEGHKGAHFADPRKNER
jgi:hypothetical protein